MVAETTIVVDAGPELVQVRLSRRGLRPARDARLHALRSDDVEPARDVAGRLDKYLGEAYFPMSVGLGK